MKRFIQGLHRGQSALLPESLGDCVADTNPVRVVDVFVYELDIGQQGFDGVVPAEKGRPAYHPADLLKIYFYGYLRLPVAKYFRRYFSACLWTVASPLSGQAHPHAISAGQCATQLFS